MTTHISPRETADRLVAEYAEIDPMDAHETEYGMCAEAEVMCHDNEAMEAVRDSAIGAELRGELPCMDYGRIASAEAQIKGAHDDDRR